MNTESYVLNKRNKEHTCSFEIAIDLIGGKWQPIIIWHLGTKGTRRFSELKKLLPQKCFHEPYSNTEKIQ